MNRFLDPDHAHAIHCELVSKVLNSPGALRLRAAGWSMLPTIWPGDTLVIEPAGSAEIFPGDIVLFSRGHRFIAHRVTKCEVSGEFRLRTQGDSVPSEDSPVSGKELMGKISMIQRKGKCIDPKKGPHFAERAAAALFRRSEFAARVVVGVHGMLQTSHQN